MRESLYIAKRRIRIFQGPLFFSRIPAVRFPPPMRYLWRGISARRGFGPESVVSVFFASLSPIRARYGPSPHASFGSFAGRVPRRRLLPARLMALLCPRLTPRGPPQHCYCGCDGHTADLSHRRQAMRPPRIRTPTVPVTSCRSCRYARNHRANASFTLCPEPLTGWALVVMSSQVLSVRVAGHARPGH